MQELVLDDVRVHPRGTRDEGIRGMLRLAPPPPPPDGAAAADSSASRLEWAPAALLPTQQLEAAGYAFSVALRDVRAIRKAKPAKGSGVAGGALTLVGADGVSLGPLYFHRPGGLQQLWRELEARVRLAETPDDPTLYRVNDLSDQLTRSMIAFQTSAPVSPPDSAAVAPSARVGTAGAAPRLADLQWRVWEGLGQVVRFVDRTFIGNGPRTPIPTDSGTPTPTRFPVVANQPTEIGAFEVVGGGGSGGRQDRDRMLRSESLEMLPVGRREKPLSAADWIALFDSSGRIGQRGRDEFLNRAFYGGFSEEIRSEAWLFLLGFYDYNSTPEERAAISLRRGEEYRTIRAQWQTLFPEQIELCSKFRSRREQVAKDVHRTDRDYPFFEAEGNPNLRKLDEVLLTYVQYNQDLGYAQGMNDLAAIILNVMQGDEVRTFWCFKRLMDRLGSLFRKDQAGMTLHLRALSRIVATMDPQLYGYLESIKSTEMFFCFRWLLVFFKREFSFDTSKRLWEALLSDHLSLRFELFFAAAIVIHNRDAILTRELQFDDILQLMNTLSGTMAVEPLLIEAECLFLGFLRCADRTLKEFVLGGSSSLP